MVRLRRQFIGYVVYVYVGSFPYLALSTNRECAAVTGYDVRDMENYYSFMDMREQTLQKRLGGAFVFSSYVVDLDLYHGF